LSTITAWEAGLTCGGCQLEFTLGEDVMFWHGAKLHPACAAADAAARRVAAGEGEDVLEVACRLVSAGGRAVLTRSQLRALVDMAVQRGLVPVRRPDQGTRQRWHGKLAGWSAARVAAGLDADEVAGMWTDFLEAGRLPPVRHRDLRLVVAVITALPLPARDVTGRRRVRRPKRRDTPMTDRTALAQAVAAAHARGSGQDLARAVAALDSWDRQRAAQAAGERESDLGARLAAQRLTPVPLHEHHTAATDWLADWQEPRAGYREAMIAQASSWYRSLDPAVRRDGGELAEQARGRARSLASAHGAQAPAAEAEFLSVVGYLSSREGASGLPQVDQTVDPDNAPSATPYPTEVFDTFGEEQDPFNQVEGDGHDSQAASTGAPMLGLINRQENSGSGFGSGPEKPDEHTTAFDTADSYAEVPLGPPGTIPTAAPGQGPSAPTAPTPIQGQPQDAGADRRPVVASVDGYSLPDPFGYRWAMQREVMHPFHERCGSAHWPDEGCCGDRSHTASVAVGYLMDYDQARRAARCERIGAAEGLRAVTASRGPADLGAWHNRVTAGWGSSDRTAEDSAVLHGFLAIVRPVLAESQRCGACSGGDCGGCAGGSCSCGHPGRKTAAAGDPHVKVVQYLSEMAREYGAAPVGGK
jgi:hypothetical protein